MQAESKNILAKCFHTIQGAMRQTYAQTTFSSHSLQLTETKHSNTQKKKTLVSQNGRFSSSLLMDL